MALTTLTTGVMALAAAVPAQAVSPTHAFASHQTYQVGVMLSASQATRDAAVEKQYDSWTTAPR